MSDIERQKLIQFNKDPILKEAVRKVLLAEIYERGTLRADIKSEPTKNFALALAFDPKYTNEQLGEDLKAAANGLSLLERGFTRLEEYKELPAAATGGNINKAM